MTRLLCLSTILVLLACISRAEDFNRNSLPIPQPPFEGKIGLRIFPPR